MAALGFPEAAWARTVEGYRFEENVRVGNVDLQLNGVGVRAVSIFKGYVAALYVPERSADPGRILAEAGPKRVRLRMLLGADAATFIKALNGGLTRNSSAADIDRLRNQIDRFNANLREGGAVKTGDLVDIEYLPGMGTRVALNGHALGESVPGSVFYDAFLKIFIGEKVQDLPLKAHLLGTRDRL